MHAIFQRACIGPWNSYAYSAEKLVLAYCASLRILPMSLYGPWCQPGYFASKLVLAHYAHLRNLQKSLLYWPTVPICKICRQARIGPFFSHLYAADKLVLAKKCSYDLDRYRLNEPSNSYLLFFGSLLLTHS
jgi:hypothetical protein